MNETVGRPSQTREPRLFNRPAAGGRLNHRRGWLAIAELRKAPGRSHPMEVTHGSITGSERTRCE
jgi:hypothetical protein